MRMTRPTRLREPMIRVPFFKEVHPQKFESFGSFRMVKKSETRNRSGCCFFVKNQMILLSNPIIFRKLLCGGFGILMSQNYQTEKNIAFHWCAKMVGWLHLHSAPHIWYTDAPDKQPWTFLKIYGGAYSVWCYLGMSWGVWGRVLVYFGGILWC